MRRLVLLSIALLVLIGIVAWLVSPMFLAPTETRLGDCEACEALLELTPLDAGRVVVVPHGGTTLFELARRIDPGREIMDLLPAPGLLAIGLGDAPVVAWIDSKGRLGAAAAPSGPRSVLARVAANRYGGRGLRWTDGILTLGEVGRSKSHTIGDFGPGEAEGHFFARHDLGLPESTAKSVGRLGRHTLDIETFRDVATESASVVGEPQHPNDSIVSIAVADLSIMLAPIEEILPVRLGSWGGAGQIVVYGLETKGLLPRVRGILLVESDDDPDVAIDRLFPSIEGVTRDAIREIGDVQVFRRETLGVVVETARRGGRLAIALDGGSIDRLLNGEMRPAESEAIWSFDGDPAAIDAALGALRRSPGRYVLSKSAQKRLARLRAVVGPFRTATRVSSSLTPRSGGSVIVTRVTW